jgi:hypothetical protein
VRDAKFLVAGKPATNRRPVWHPGIGTDGAKAFAAGEAVAPDRWEFLAISYG